MPFLPPALPAVSLISSQERKETFSEKEKPTKGKIEDKCQGDQAKVNEMGKGTKQTLLHTRVASSVSDFPIRDSRDDRIVLKMMPNPFDLLVRWRVFEKPESGK